MQKIKEIISIIETNTEINDKINMLGNLKFKSGSTFYIEPKNKELIAIAITVIENKIARVSLVLKTGLGFDKIHSEFGEILNIGFNRMDDEILLNMKYQNYNLSFIVIGNYKIIDKSLYQNEKLVEEKNIFIERLNINSN